MLGFFQDRLGTGEGRIGILQIGWRIDCTAVLAGVAVLVLGGTLRTFALDVAIRQEHALDRVEELLDFFRYDQFRGLELFIYVLRQRDVFRRMGRVPVVEAHQKMLPVGIVLSTDTGDQCLRRDAFGFRAQHDRRAMRICRTHEVHFVALHALKTHPNIAVKLIDDVPDMERPVGIGQCGSRENFSGHQIL